MITNGMLTKIAKRMKVSSTPTAIDQTRDREDPVEARPAERQRNASGTASQNERMSALAIERLVAAFGSTDRGRPRCGGSLHDRGVARRRTCVRARGRLRARARRAGGARRGVRAPAQELARAQPSRSSRLPELGRRGRADAWGQT